MSDSLQLLPLTIERLQKHAKPFIDTVDSVVNRILDEYENGGVAPKADDAPADEEVQSFEPGSPPNLTYTKVLSVLFNHKTFDRSETNWNGLVNEAVRFARKNIRADESLRRVVLANFFIGKKEDEGYRHLPDANISVQGQDANAAWRTVFHIAKHFDLPFEIVFVWRSKEGAQFPGVIGEFKSKSAKLRRV